MHTEPGHRHNSPCPRTEEGVETEQNEESYKQVADPSTGRVRLCAARCTTCIFHHGNPMHLDPGAVASMVAIARAAQGHIVCHATLGTSAPAICRGYAEGPDQGISLALRLARALGTLHEITPPDSSLGSPPEVREGTPAGASAPLPDHRYVNDPAWQRRWAAWKPVTIPLRERGWICDVDFGADNYLVRAVLPDDSYLQISHDLHADGPEVARGWLVTREWEDGPRRQQVLYDSIPEQDGIPAGPHAHHGPDLAPLLTAVDTHFSNTQPQP